MKNIFLGAAVAILLVGCGGQSTPLSSSRLETIRAESADIANAEWEQEFSNVRWTQCQDSINESERLWRVLQDIEAEIVARKNADDRRLLGLFGQPGLAEYQVEFARALGFRDGIEDHFNSLGCRDFPDFQDTAFPEYSVQG